MNRFNVQKRDRNYGNPFMPQKDQVYVYIDRSGLVVYCSNRDSLLNFPNKSLRRYVLRASQLGIFVRYYQLRLHPEALNNVIH